MRIRFPLYAKILLWFFLNLVFLGLVFYAFFKIQFRLGLDSLLMGRAGEHIEAVSQVIGNELNQTLREEWSTVLKRFSDAYQVQFYLFQSEGRQVAGEPIQVPDQVQARLIERAGPTPRPLPPGSPPPGSPRRADFSLPPDSSRFAPGAAGRGGTEDESEDRRGPPPRGSNERAGWPDGSPPQGGPNRPLREPPRGGPHSRSMMHTTKPGRYWVLVRMGVQENDRPRPMPATLLAMSTSIRGGGLFFDFVPWAWVCFGVLFVSVLFWFPLVRGITRYISQMTQATEAIAEGRFEAPVQSERGDELGRLSQAISRMASRLAGFVHGQKRFLGDIAHELCSPLARMQVALGILEERGDPKQQAYVEDVREEVQHMSSLVNELLSFSKAGLRQKEIKLQPVNLEALVRRVVTREAPGRQQIEIQIDSSLQALAEPELLSRAVANLVRNALRYAGDAGPITLSATPDADQLVLVVADHGPGVPEEMLGQIFDPFFRLEASRSRDTGGIGLGLAIVKTCVEACQGKVTARNRQPTGLEVEIVLRSPASAPSR